MLRYSLAKFIPSWIFRPNIWSNSRRFGNVVRILLFHDISNSQLHIFEELICFIEKNYSFLVPQQFHSFLLDKNKSTGQKFMLSFDDGFLSQVKVVKEILNPKGIKAIFFICPSFIGLEGQRMREFISKNIHNDKVKSKNISEDLKPMTWDDLKSLIEAGHHIGAHTLSHRQLSEVQDEVELRREIVESGNILEKKLGFKIEWFAYPFGNNKSINARAYKMIKKRYRFCCTGLRGKNTLGTNHYSLYRDHVDLDAPMHYLKFILNGGLDVFYAGRRKELKQVAGMMC